VTIWKPNRTEEGRMAEFPAPTEGILLTHFIVSDDVERSRRFYTDVLGGETRGGEIRCYIRDPDGHLIDVGETSPAFLEQIA
jgi:hypothetical protein